MNRIHLTSSIYACAMLAGSLFILPVSVQAIPASLSNETMTTYDSVTGNVTFNWDQNSQYAITGTEVTLYRNDIIIPGLPDFFPDANLNISSELRLIGTIYEFVIPNFYDPLPMKKIEISMLGANRGASGFELPSVLDIIGADSDFANGGAALPVLGSYVSGTISPTLVTEYWEMFPNPDFEIVKLYVPVQFELQSISIATQSTVVPVPAAIWLFGSGILALVGMARRKVAY